MIIPISINAQDILDQYSISKSEAEDAIDHTIKEIAAEFANKWIETANQELNSTRDRYTSSIRVVDEGRMTGTILLDYSKDPLIKMIEEGASQFDQKEGFAKSTKKHIKKDGGWYLTIPFSATTPGSLGSAALPASIYSAVKKLPINPTTNRSAGLNTENVKVGSFAEPIPKQKIKIPESQAFQEYKRKSSIYEGVYSSKDKVTGQSSYGSFRRVSDKSDNNSWIHPGIEAANIAEKAMDRFEANIETIASEKMDESLRFFGIE